MKILKSKLFGKRAELTKEQKEQLKQAKDKDTKRRLKESIDAAMEASTYHGKRMISKQAKNIVGGVAAHIGATKIAKKYPELLKNKDGKYSAGKSFLLYVGPIAVTAGKSCYDSVAAQKEIKREVDLFNKINQAKIERDDYKARNREIIVQKKYSEVKKTKK